MRAIRKRSITQEELQGICERFNAEKPHTLELRGDDGLCVGITTIPSVRLNGFFIQPSVCIYLKAPNGWGVLFQRFRPYLAQKAADGLWKLNMPGIDLDYGLKPPVIDTTPLIDGRVPEDIVAGRAVMAAEKYTADVVKAIMESRYSF